MSFEDAREPSITICGVYHSEANRALLESNWRLAAALNPGISAQWLVADNTDRGACERFGDESVRIVPGVRVSELPALRVPDSRGSFQHAYAINKLLGMARTRYALILDSDFYIVRPDWIRGALDHMRQNGLAFFGSTWHPRYYTKYRYFPTVHCFFADLEKVPAGDLDFMPGTAEEKRKKPWYAKFPRRMRRPLLALTFQDRKFIGDSRDTGWTMYERFAQRPDVRWECLQAVYRPWRDLGFPASFLYWPNRVIEAFLPDRFCFVPKKKGYYAAKGFCELGHPDVRGTRVGWEEYLWQGRPFGFHLRGTKARYHGAAAGDRLDADFARIRRFLDWFARAENAPDRTEHNSNV